MKKKILIVEDEADVRENISELLVEEGYEVMGARNGLEGFASIKKFRPDLVICDVTMPLMGGLELLKRIQDEKINFDKPFIFLSARAAKENMRMGMNLGADDYITKPYTREEILEAVSSRMNKSESMESKNSLLRANILNSLPQELLTPLNAIYLGSDLLRKGGSTISTEEVQECGEMIFSSAAKMKDVFSRYICLLEIFSDRSSENESNSLSNEICKLPDDIIKIAAEEIAAKHKRSKDLKLKIDRSSLNIFDNHLFRIAYELVDNAFKFSAPGSLVIVLGGISFSTYLFSVSNIGSSMSEEQISMIGEFMQFGRKKKEFPGMGLGLEIAKSYCQNYQADFDITSTNNSVTVNCRFKIRK